MSLTETHFMKTLKLALFILVIADGCQFVKIYERVNMFRVFIEF